LLYIYIYFLITCFSISSKYQDEIFMIHSPRYIKCEWNSWNCL